VWGENAKKGKRERPRPPPGQGEHERRVKTGSKVRFRNLKDRPRHSKECERHLGWRFAIRDKKKGLKGTINLTLPMENVRLKSSRKKAQSVFFGTLALIKNERQNRRGSAKVAAKCHGQAGVACALFLVAPGNSGAPSVC